MITILYFFKRPGWQKQQLDNLSGLGVSHFAFGRADYDFDGGLVLGRGHGGNAIYWSKNLKATSFSNCDGSTIGLRVFLKKSRVVSNLMCTCHAAVGLILMTF